MVNSAVENAIDELTLFDDELMTLVFDQNVPAAECLLRIVLMDNTIKVKSVISQRELRAAEVGKRSVRLDILAEDAYGRLMNIEVQRRRDGAVPQRARLHSALVDTGILPEGAEFEEMPDSYVIFITEHDYYKAGLP
ncbi:MAG: PD-(D/E)XK nuclease family transposase, partial [Lachnospiraceae bacterium]|nr:PD-(D/E)XK nuclease family transposase [Lachnospiraceae bacterium]